MLGMIIGAVVGIVAAVLLAIVVLHLFLRMDEQYQGLQSKVNQLNDDIALLRDQTALMQSELDRIASAGDRATLTRSEAECILASVPGSIGYYGHLDQLSDNDLIRALYHTEAFETSVAIEIER